jgi:hypothetical protein
MIGRYETATETRRLMPSELARVEPETTVPITPMGLIQSAILQGAGIDTIERLAKLQREMVEYDAKVQFADSLHRAQGKMRPIAADAVNPQTHSKYASYSALDRALRPIYSEEGFSLSFNTAESTIPDHMRVLCDVSRGGYTRTYQIDMPADGKGAKGGDVMTKTHATGAAASYGMRYLLKMIFNVAVGEDDRDGNAGMEDSVVQEWVDAINQCSDIGELQRTFAEAYKAARKIGDKDSMTRLIAAKDARKMRERRR